MRALGRAILWVTSCVGLAGCQHAGPASPRADAPQDRAEAAGAGAFDVKVYRRAEAERFEFYEREVERLRADLAEAEEYLVAMESGLAASRSRADAVSAIAEARIALERVSLQVPWRTDRVEEARAKLAEASRQLEAGNVGSSLFFSSRARRITANLQLEAQHVAAWPEKRLVDGEGVRLRTGPSREYDVVEMLVAQTPVYPERGYQRWTLVRTPSGQIGWVYSELLETP
jgi:hypothetical protein